MRPSYIQPSSTLFNESDRSTDSVIAVLDNTQALKLKKKLHNQRLHINLGNFHEIVLHDVPGSD